MKNISVLGTNHFSLAFGRLPVPIRLAAPALVAAFGLLFFFTSVLSAQKVPAGPAAAPAAPAAAVPAPAPAAAAPAPAAAVSAGLPAAPQPFDLTEKIERTGRFAPLFPFVIGPDVAENGTNVAFLTAASADSPIRIQDGKFVDASGNVRHFLATNICFGGCFPDHDGAERTAKRLARLGINLVRLHYVHHTLHGGLKYDSTDSFMQPELLEKFDYLFWQLRKNGIYVDLTLNIARKFGEAQGFGNANLLPWYNNGLDNFENRMISLQKKYVSELLNHVNPYTKTAYRDEPAVAMVELANENSIVNSWFAGRLDELPEPYVTQLRTRWNDWLEKKYGTSAKVREAWTVRGMEPGQEFIPDGTLADPEWNAHAKDWSIQNDSKSAGSWERLEAPNRVLRVQIEKIGLTPNIPQFARAGLRVEQNRYYSVSFRARSVKRTDPQAAPFIAVRISQMHDPWGVAGPRMKYALSEEWQRFEYSFRSGMTDEAVRLVFADFQPGTVEIADVSFREGISAELLGLKGSLKRKSFPLVTMPRWELIPRQTLDFMQFLHDVEQDYFQTMADFTKNVVGCRHPLSSTQVNYGFRNTHASFDYCDAHSYWNHPVFPGKSWDAKEWYLINDPMVNFPERSNLSHLSSLRVLGKPYTISEYDHPYPNLYGAEGLVMLASYGAFQDWDAIFNFAWAHSADDVRDVISPMFDLCSNSVKQVHLPACRNLFVRGDVRRGPFGTVQQIPLPQTLEVELAAQGRNRYLHSSQGLPWNRPLAHAVFTGLKTEANAELWEKTGNWKCVTDFQELPASCGSPEKGWIRSDSGEIYWNFEQKDAGYYQVDTPRTTALTGFVRGRTFDFHALSLQPGATRLDWLTFTLTQTRTAAELQANAKESKTAGSVSAARAVPAAANRLAPGVWLLAATGLAQNTESKIMDLDFKNRISVAERMGGSNGHGPELCEGIPARLLLKNLRAQDVTLFPLTPDGNRKVPVAGTQVGKDVLLEMDPKYQTLWYEIQIQGN